MKSVQLLGYGGNEALRVNQVPVPEPGAGQLLVKVMAAGVNPVDYKIRDGKLKPILPLRFPQTLGGELAGVVEKLGPGVSGFNVGESIFARVDKQQMGAFAEYAVVDAAHAARMPSNLSFEEAAGIPLAGLTAWQCLFEVLKLQPKQKILIHAGGGGVGGLAIQFAKNAGAYVATTASPAAKAVVEAYGADEIINYREEKFETVLSDYDHVLDTVGDDTLLRSFGVIKKGHTVVSVAGVPEPQTAKDIDKGLLIKSIFWAISSKIRKAAKKAGVHYRYLFMHPDGKQLSEIAKLIEEGKVKAKVDRVFDLEKATEAFSYLETGHAKGKVILRVRSGRI
ncbi:MAG: NADP-dependent oxidoreductase [Bdellovibrionales bacterium]|nr:NADP-dependent oxidoreductase [Bdellovibrionales bacterium]